MLPVVYLGDSQVLIHYVIKVSQYLGVFNKYGIQLYILANHKTIVSLIEWKQFSEWTIHLDKDNALKNVCCTSSLTCRLENCYAFPFS